MAIISFTNYKRGQTTGCMSAVMRYTMQDKKTEFEGQQLVTGINCQPESVYADFMTTKRLYHKTDGVLFYHMVQSFPKGEAVDPVTAHAAALKLAEYYEGYEVLVCTHTDREHIHSHFLINSVNFDTGRKLHIAKEQLQELRQRNDMVCKEFSLPVFQPREQKQKTKTMTIGEYHTAARGQSKKLQLMNIINDCMRHASNREEFIALMESEGYKVRWEKSRKNITYTTPSGWQCRDRLLFGDKYLKENMEYEFRIREEIIYGRAHDPEPARAFTAADSAGVEFTDHAHCHPVSVAGGSDDTDTEDRIQRVGSAWNAGVSSEPEITHTDLTAVQNSMAKIQKSLTEMTTLLEQAGKKKEKHSCKWLDWLPDFELIVVAKWIVLVLLIVAALLGMGYGTATVVSNIRNLFL